MEGGEEKVVGVVGEAGSELSPDYNGSSCRNEINLRYHLYDNN